MYYRLATIEDLTEICNMIEAAKQLMSEQGIEQWDDVYPVYKDFFEDIKKETMYVVLKDGQLAAIYVISEECDGEYLKCKWENKKPCIIHRFCVSPSFQNNGIGKAVLNHIEAQLTKAGYDSVRLDVFTQNPYALRLYEKNGYVKRGFADWRKGRFLLMEKKLDESADSIFLTEANENYTDELQKFKEEVLQADKDNDDQFAGCMGLRDCSTAKEWIDICNLRKSAETCEKAGTKVPSTTYFAIRESDHGLVGVIDLRHHINHPILESWGGHCGYSVRPSERGKGYGAEMLRLNAINAGKLGIEKMLVVCDEDNVASEKTILANGGQLENTIEVDGCRMKRFWINTL
ncbi:GNAT family N-acetyltransferase [Butyrivibrio sp. AD3002]|uniref:GNAT family N-acetyltransferase n=1 Tax=Butyrivibrio sp. AD3002 TaxID=1280670 RepID=UPI000406F64C|nr:GNAT family N-acetyltransferase [Butyrivibrio sp. AD3002]